MTSMMLDLLALFVLAFCILQGYRKGFFLTLMGIIIIFVSAFGAASIAEKNSEPLSGKLQPVLSWVSDDAVDQAMKGRSFDLRDEAQIKDVASAAFSSLGIHQTSKLTQMVINDIKITGLTVREAVSKAFLFSLTYTLLCVFSFVMLMLVLTLILHFIASIFKLPVIKTIDRYIGLGLGFFYGFLLLSVIGWAVKYSGGLVKLEIINATILLRLFINAPILSGILSF